MTVYSFYIFDRHSKSIILYTHTHTLIPLPYYNYQANPLTPPSPPPAECIYTKKWLPPSQAAPPPATPGSKPSAQQQQANGARAISRASNDAKLIFGTVFSLRNIVRKLGGDDDAFISYRTGQYRLHYYETPTNLRFVLLTDTGTMSMRNVLHQIYINLWVEYGMCFLAGLPQLYPVFRANKAGQQVLTVSCPL